MRDQNNLVRLSICVQLNISLYNFAVALQQSGCYSFPNLLHFIIRHSKFSRARAWFYRDAASDNCVRLGLTIQPKKSSTSAKLEFPLSENTVDSISEKTLHSLNLSCNGEPVSLPENLANGSNETLQKSHLTPDEKTLNVSNAHCISPEPEQLTAAKKPSYLGLACSISGYSGITRYDSKLREGFRSRDSSPGTRLITRDTSPAGFRWGILDDFLTVFFLPEKRAVLFATNYSKIADPTRISPFRHLIIRLRVNRYRL